MITTEGLIQIKAALYTGGNKEKFVEQAVKAYREPEKEQHLLEVPLMVHGKEVTITDVPGLMIDGEIRGNLHLLSALEEVLNELDQVPTKLSFKDIINA